MNEKAEYSFEVTEEIEPPLMVRVPLSSGYNSNPNEAIIVFSLNRMRCHIYMTPLVLSKNDIELIHEAIKMYTPK